MIVYLVEDTEDNGRGGGSESKFRFQLTLPLKEEPASVVGVYGVTEIDGTPFGIALDLAKK